MDALAAGLMAAEIKIDQPTLNGVIALAIGVLILIVPRLLNYLVAGYLIIIGLIQIFDINI